MTAPVPNRHTHTAIIERTGVIIDYRTGSTTVLTGTALARWLDALEQSAAPAPVTVQASAISWGTSESAACLPFLPRPPWRWALAATVLLLCTLGVRQLGSRRTRFGRLVRLAEAGRNLSPPPREQAALAVRSVRWVARFLPARVACLEESTAASLLLACRGRGGAWRHGIATDPIRLHAWICDIHARPVEEPDQTDDYTPLNTPAATAKRHR
ncbi:lasso peptide biosynthesis B2 protein [Streptomyces jumonjinensis]|uniref:Lasso peptide biosynthesis B2 protein n=1 Tax=Streptomyces jumonjinensis TaxID=1945 RepID=A0A646KG14_STRJU|nr:lasso peptide biosynthesis B2 protein [Streptomyces jumonjinensis]MQT01173.1 lasso peptide biosynthesis B2 protein [Streptomyces jumonjinensis]